MDNLSKCSLWSKRLVDCQQSGLTVIEYCRQNSLPIKSYYYWKRRLADIDASILAVEPVQPGGSSTAWLCLEPLSSVSPDRRPSLTVKISGAEIEVGPDFNPGLLRAVVEALGVQPC